MPAVLFAALLLMKLELVRRFGFLLFLRSLAALNGVLLTEKGERLLGAGADAGGFQLADGLTLPALGVDAFV